ncbi:DNA-binding response regulator [Methylomonas lenta]|uniref:DNA-binding response regulator n=1 Tax=Methylomonas lenta TaxID=980561 RepID=A0A177NE21_9GAMM|nr:response regulator transcription factor [Methylomonas lenta]OAI16101.1 DNA-binding response regulator [Methylomonas lenta]
MISIILADDHAIMRGGLKQLFTLTEDIVVAAEAQTGQELLDLLQEIDIKLVLLDLTMPGGGIDLISQLRTLYVDLPVLVLSMHNELQTISRSLKAGASGYLTKDNDPETLLLAIRKVANGGRYIDPKTAEKLVFESDNSQQKSLYEKLSVREMQILQLLASGKSVNEIGHELAISNKTVSTHKARLFEKLELNNNAELIRYYDAQDLKQ